MTGDRIKLIDTARFALNELAEKLKLSISDTINAALIYTRTDICGDKDDEFRKDAFTRLSLAGSMVKAIKRLEGDDEDE